MFNLFMTPKPPQPTFDEVASERAKQVRANIGAAAQSKLTEAMHLAQNGQPEEAKDKIYDYNSLKSLAISIPLDMVAEGM